jgi:hypothetical protein
MQKKVWLFLGVAAVLLAAIVFAKVSNPSAVSGGEVPKPAAAAVPAPAPKPQAVKVLPSSAVVTPEPQSTMPEAAVEGAPAAQEPQPSDDGAPHVVAIFADTGNQFRALIGDALVSEGSTVRGYQVRKVQADGVVFEKDGQIWVQKVD